MNIMQIKIFLFIWVLFKETLFTRACQANKDFGRGSDLMSREETYDKILWFYERTICLRQENVIHE